MAETNVKQAQTDLEEMEKRLYQYKVFFTDGTHSYLYFYRKLRSNQVRSGWILDDTDEFINLDKCKGIRLMQEPEGVNNE